MRRRAWRAKAEGGPHAATARRRDGAVLVEFAVVALLFVVLAGAIFDYGRAFFAAQQIQRASRVAAREIALLPLPPAGIGLEDALACRRSEVDMGLAPCDALAAAPALPREVVFDSDFLAIQCGDTVDCGSEAALDAFFSTLPVVNQLLRPLMIFDRDASCSGSGEPPCLLRYPGALVSDAASVTGLSVVIPVVVDDGAFACVPVVEPVGADFGVGAGGLVTLRVNYPFQAAALLSWNVDDEGNSAVIDAEDPGACAGLGGLAPLPTLGALPVATGTSNAGPNAGALGLGRQLAFGRVVRPFRRVISSEAAFRREFYL